MDCLLRLSQPLQDLPTIAEFGDVDTNPPIVPEKGALAVDARIVLNNELLNSEQRMIPS